MHRRRTQHHLALRRRRPPRRPGRCARHRDALRARRGRPGHARDPRRRPARGSHYRVPLRRGRPPRRNRAPRRQRATLRVRRRGQAHDAHRCGRQRRRAQHRLHLRPQQPPAERDHRRRHRPRPSSPPTPTTPSATAPAKWWAKEAATPASTQYAYDHLNRLIAQTDGNQHRHAARLRRLRQPRAHQHRGPHVHRRRHAGQRALRSNSFEYDGRNLLIREENGAGNVIERQYDGAGNLRFQVAGAGSADAATTEFRYDLGNRLTAKVIDPQGLALTTQYAYDARGNLVSETNADGLSTHTRFDRARSCHRDHRRRRLQRLLRVRPLRQPDRDHHRAVPRGCGRRPATTPPRRPAPCRPPRSSPTTRWIASCCRPTRSAP